MDALTRYHYAKECEESAVLYINDAYLEALNSLENLEAENARLREELADAPKCETCEAMLDCDECLRADGSHKERRRLKAENAKLRELARHMRTCMEHYEMDGTISCDRCPLDNDTGNCDFERRMSELGVDE